MLIVDKLSLKRQGALEIIFGNFDFRQNIPEQFLGEHHQTFGTRLGKYVEI